MKFLLGACYDRDAEDQFNLICSYADALRDKFASECVSVELLRKSFTAAPTRYYSAYWAVFEFKDKESEFAFKLKFGDREYINNYIRECKSEI